MPEYMEREAVLNELNRNSITKKITLADGVSIFDTIKNIPAADVVEVVHCSQCGKWNKQICKHHGLKTEYYDFCSYGERKEGAEE